MLTDLDLFGAKYDEQRCTVKEEPCAYCGRPVKIDRPHFRIEFDGQGTYALGSNCQRLFADAVRSEGVVPS